MTRWWLGIVIVVAAEAGAAPGAREPAFTEHELLAGESLGLPVPSTSIPIPSRAEAFDLDADMQAFVADLVDLRDARHRLVTLLERMEQRGLFSLDYAETTRTARATFHERQGNCLSFTMLFIGLARAAGLPAAYQTVAVPPTWSNDGHVVIASHVNAAVRTRFNEDSVVDFNIRSFEGDHPRYRVDDDYALALFYTNLGAEALLRGEHAASLALLGAAARTYPDMPGTWVNLGVLYARHDLNEHAEAAYLRALEVDDDEPSALANLALVYEELGERQLANEYARRIRGYRERNPYYHYSLAAGSLERAEWPEALAAVRKALRLKHDDPEFHELRGRALEAIGRTRDAAQSFARAREYAAVEAARAESRVLFDSTALR